jgi:alpha-L-rhamnosidase
VAADHSSKIHSNGALAGSGNNWQQPAEFKHPLAATAKELVIAIEAENTVYQRPNAAGLIGIFEVTLDAGTVLTSPTGGSRESASGEEAGWNQPGFDDSTWKDAQVLGENGIRPWNRVALTDNETFKGGLGF